MRLTVFRGGESRCETCDRTFERGEAVSYGGRGKTYHRGECAEAAGAAAFPGRPSRRGGMGTTYTGLLAA